MKVALWNSYSTKIFTKIVVVPFKKNAYVEKISQVAKDLTRNKKSKFEKPAT